VETGRGVLLFLGESGAGKSTISKLLATAAPFEVLADDVVYLRLYQGAWHALDGSRYLSRLRKPDHPQLPCGAGVGSRVLAITLIHKHATPGIRPLSMHAYVRGLIDAMFEISAQARTYRAGRALRWFRIACRVAEQNCGYTLRFTKADDTVVAVSEWLASIRD